MRLRDKVAIVVGAGQSPGEGMGNGRATALTFAREGAKIFCVDHNLASAQETVDRRDLAGRWRGERAARLKACYLRTRNDSNWGLTCFREC
jgi:NAD(P)-dependent dehydrogenase (short-subunit alcohol dehydrogenase family)